METDSIQNLTENSPTQFTKRLLEHVTETSDPSIPQLQEREKNKRFEVQRERENKKTKNLTLFFLSEESITLVRKTNPTQQKFNLQNLKAKIFTAKCG